MLEKTSKPEHIVTFGRTFQVTWSDDGSIVAYIVCQLSADALQIWADAALNTVKCWPADKPYLALYDLSDNGTFLNNTLLAPEGLFSLGLTQDGEERVQTVIAQRKNFVARVAVFVSADDFDIVTQALTGLEDKGISRTIRYKVFSNRNAALSWLYEMV